MTYKKEITINKDIQTVFDKLTDPDFMPKWQKLDSYEKNEEGKMVYSDSHSRKKMEITENVLEKKSPNRFKVEYTTSGVWNLMDNKLEKVDENTTKWTSDNEFKFTNLFMKVIGFLFRGSFPGQTEKDMKAFKAAVEKL